MKKIRKATIGVLSDTHLTSLDDRFARQAEAAFGGCDTIVHAGDLTNPEILGAFAGKELHAVHGNMCGLAARSGLPESLTFTVAGFRFGLCHGHRLGQDIHAGLIARFPGVDCIIFGHTHYPLVERFAQTLLVNPGSFRGTGRYGGTPSYAIISVDETGLSAALNTLQEGS